MVPNDHELECFILSPAKRGVGGSAKHISG